MTRPDPSGVPRFWWRGMLILLPVALLAGLGFWQLRHDRLAVMQTSREQARDDIERLLDLGTAALSEWEWPEAMRCEVTADGTPLGLAIYTTPPEPELNEVPEAEELRRLRESDLLPAKRMEAARALAGRSEAAKTAAGLPVSPLAAHLAFVSAREARLPEEEISAIANLVCQLAVEQASALSETLLEEVRTEASDYGTWHRQWLEDEWLRGYFAANGTEAVRLLTGIGSMKVLSSQSPSRGPMLSRLVRHGEELIYEISDRQDIERLLNKVEQLVGVGSFASVRWSMATNGTHEQEELEKLAEGTREVVPLEAAILLADIDALLAPQSSRTRQTALMIGLSALAVTAGWFASWRAFRAQVALARMKDNFASSVSHELRAPISSIRIMAESLESGRAEGAGKTREYARLIAGESARLGVLVENVLAFSRLESGRDAFEFEDGDAGAALRAAVDLLRPSAEERGITLRGDAPPDGELTIAMDAPWISRALVNLLDNAIKYGPEKATVIANVESMPNGGARFAVADAGEPIPSAERESIFQKFYRRGSELTRETQGVGLGLGLVRAIAEAHGGRAYVEGDGNGTRFAMEICATES